MVRHVRQGNSAPVTDFLKKRGVGSGNSTDDRRAILYTQVEQRRQRPDAGGELSMIGKIVSHYRIIEKLGGGGMGVVHKARDKHLDPFLAANARPPEWQPAPSWPLKEVRSGQ